MLFDNSQQITPDFSVLVSVRDDRRIQNLLAAFQQFDTRQFLVCIANDLCPEPFIKSLPDPLYGFIIHHHRQRSIADKINSLIEHARTDWVIVLESDAVPTQGWLEDIARIIRTEQKDAVHLCGEIYAKLPNLNNVLFRRRPEIPKHESDTYYANDTGWFLACEQRGIPIVKHDRRGLVFHDTNTSSAYRRFLLYARDYGYLAAKYHNFAFAKRKVLEESYHLVRGLINLPLFIVCFLFFTIVESCRGRKSH